MPSSAINPYKTALITDITGQDGRYLAELLLDRATRYMASSVGPAARASGPLRKHHHPDRSPTKTRTRVIRT